MVKQAQLLIGRLDQKVFDAIYSRSLVYNSRWEDRAVDFYVAPREPPSS